MNETYDETCPYCNMIIRDLWEYFSFEEDAEFECPYCSMKIIGTAIRDVTYNLKTTK